VGKLLQLNRIYAIIRRNRKCRFIARAQISGRDLAGRSAVSKRKEVYVLTFRCSCCDVPMAVRSARRDSMGMTWVKSNYIFKGGNHEGCEDTNSVLGGNV